MTCAQPYRASAPQAHKLCTFLSPTKPTNQTIMTIMIVLVPCQSVKTSVKNRKLQVWKYAQYWKAMWCVPFIKYRVSIYQLKNSVSIN